MDRVKSTVNQRQVSWACNEALSLCYGSLNFAWDNPGEPVLEETFTHSHLLWSSIIPYLLSPSIMIHDILSVQFTCLAVFFPQSLFKFSLVYLLAWQPPLHTPYISSPNHCLLFTAHAHTTEFLYKQMTNCRTTHRTLQLHVHIQIMLLYEWQNLSHDCICGSMIKKGRIYLKWWWPSAS